MRSPLFIWGIIWLLVLLSKTESVSIEAENTRIHTYKGNLTLSKPNGKIFIEKVMGNCEVSTGAGSLYLGVVEGDVIATTDAGDVEIEEVGGAAKVFTKSGNIHIKRAKNFVTAETSIGEIIIESAKFVHAKNITGGDTKVFNLLGYADVESAGNILIMLDNKFSGSKICDLSSELGDITVYLPEDLGANITIKTPITMDPKRRTRIESDFYFKGFDQRCGPKEQFFYMTTAINNGGRKINFFIDKGNIYIRKLPKGELGRFIMKEEVCISN